MQIFGYAIIDVALLGGFLFLVYLRKGSLEIKINWVLVFCVYMILQVLRGMIVLADFRMFYWFLFFIILYCSHLYLIGLYNKSKIDLKFVEKIFNYSLVYFIIYGIFPFITRNADDYQGIYWVGSSGAFIVLIPLVCSHFILFQRSGYSISGLKFPSLVLYFIIAVVHYSRIGTYLLFYYLICLVYKTSLFNIKRLAMMISFVGLILFAWDTTRFLYYTGGDHMAGTGGTEITQIKTLMNDGVSSFLETSGDTARFIMILSTYDKLVSSPQEFLFGSGWYTSRFTLKSYEVDNQKKLGFEGAHVHRTKSMQVTGLTSIVSDTGMVGLIFMLYFFFKASSQIWKTNSSVRFIFISFLLSNWIFLLVGNNLTSILSFLLIFPNGILVSLARSNFSQQQVIKQIKKND